MKEFKLDYDQLAKKLLEQMPGSTQSISLEQFLDEYVSFIEKDRAPKTAEGVKLVSKKLLKYFSPLRQLETIKLKDAEDFIDSVKKTAPKGVYVYLRVLRAIWNKAMEWNYLRENPFEKVKLAKKQFVRRDYISKVEVESIIENAETDLIKDVIITAYNTGMRVGEIAQLRFSDVDIQNRIITVGNEHFTTKSKKIRYIPMNESMYQVLSRRQKTNKNNRTFVFAKSSGMQYTTDHFSKKFKAALRKSGINNDYNFHSLRHGFASRLAQNGVPIVTVSKLLGHSNISTTMIYSKVNLDDLRRGIETI